MPEGQRSDEFAWPPTERRVVSWKTIPDQFINGKRPNYADRMLTEITVEVPPEIAELDVGTPADLAERCRHVEAAITRLDAEHGARLVGLSSFLVRSESVASSRIEQVYADLDDVARASIDEAASHAALTTVAAANAMSSGDARSLVSYMIRAADVATSEAGTAALRLSELPARWRDEVRPRRGSAAGRLIDSLVANPVINASVAQRLTGTALPNTYQAIDKLTSAGVLREITGTARNRVWVAADVTAELAELGERIASRAEPSKRWR